MKSFTLPKVLNLSLCLTLLTILVMGSCSSPQHFSFRPAPPAYIQKKAPAPAGDVASIQSAAGGTFTASTSATPAALPEVAALKAALPAAANVTQAQESGKSKQKLTLAQKVVIKKLQQQATKLKQKTKRELNTTAGPVSNRSAIALILIGLVLAIFGALLGPLFYTLGTLLILIGLVLLILNYI